MSVASGTERPIKKKIARLPSAFKHNWFCDASYLACNPPGIWSEKADDGSVTVAS